MKNWKTTLIGALTAAFNIALPMVQTGQLNWQNVGVSAGIAALACVAKDWDVTGGQVRQ